MKCPECDGVGRIHYGEEWCSACNGTGEVHTNEEWFINLPTKEKARFFSYEMRCEFCPNQEQCDSSGANCKVLWEMWLKQPHTFK